MLDHLDQETDWEEYEQWSNRIEEQARREEEDDTASEEEYRAWVESWSRPATLLECLQRFEDCELI